MKLISLLIFPSFLFSQNIELAKKPFNDESQAKYEITTTDIFNSPKLLRSSNITINGIGLRTKISDLLSKYNKSIKDFEPTNDREEFILNLDGIVILTKDKICVDRISMVIIAKENNDYIGETQKYFKIHTYEEFSSFLYNKLGKPKYIYHFKNIVSESYDYYYSNGLIFYFMIGSSANAIGVSIISEENIDKIAAERNAKTPEEIKRNESKPIPLSKNGFRKTLWGMTKEQIKKLETSEYFKEINGEGAFAGLEILMFKSNVDGLNCLICYYLANNRLTRARYIVSDKHINKNNYIDDYNKIKNSLSTKYGPSSIVDGAIWADDLYKDRSDDYGIAISMGHLKYVSDWENEESYIELILKGDNYKITLWAEYIGKTFMLYEKSITDNAKKNLW